MTASDDDAETMMMQWGKLLAQTAQLGGRVVFLKDHVPTDLNMWRQALPDSLPSVVLSADDLRQNKILTRVEDLVVLFTAQQRMIEALEPVLMGQRLLLTGDEDEVSVDVGKFRYRFDFHWSNADLSKWTQAGAEAQAKLAHLEAVSQFANAHSSPCLFLDRDDVVVKNVPYNVDPQQVQLTPGICELISLAHAKGFWVALVTNQSGLGRGRIAWDQYQQVHQQMLKLLAAEGCWLDECVWGTYIENVPIEAGEYEASLRKPRSGMFLEVGRKLKVHFSSSVMVGDSASDLIAASAVGIKKLYLLKTEKTNQEAEVLSAFTPALHFTICESLKEVPL